HAPWSIQDAGFRAVIAPSFGDIFRNNCLKIGLLPVRLPEASVRRLLDLAAEDPTTTVTIDLEPGTVTAADFTEPFEIDQFSRHNLLNGWDDVAFNLPHQDESAAFASQR